MKRVTSLLTLLLTWICVSMQAQVTPLTNVPDGDYFIACPPKGNNFAYYDRTNAYLRRTEVTNAEGTYVFTLTQGTDANAGKYTIQCGGKFVVAGTKLSYSSTAGENVKLVDAAEATDDNKWWILAQDASNANFIDIFPNQANITATTPAWNFASNHNGANNAVGLYGANDGNSKWALVRTTGGGDPQIAELKLMLQATLDAISPKIGTALGQVVVNDNYTAARELLANLNATLEQLRTETANPASHYYTAILPLEGKYYIAENKNYPGKFLTTNSNNQLTYSATPGHVLFERVPGTTDQVYIKVNGQYAGACVESTTVPTVATSSEAKPYSFEYYNGYIVMQDKVLGGWRNYLHCNGTVVGWEAAAGATQWTVKPADEMLIEKIQAKLDEVDAHVGTKPGQVTTTDAYTAARALIAKDGVTLEELEAEYAKSISTYYTINMPEEGVDYVLKNFGQSGYYMSSTGNNLNSQTVAGIVNFEPVDGQTDQFYIKVNGLYVGVCYQSTQVTLSNDKANARRYSFGLYNWNVVMQDLEQTEKTNYAYLHSDGSHKIVGWENSNGCTQWILLSPTEATDLMFESLGFTAADKFDLLEGATVKYPNEFGSQQYNLTPEGINTAIDALLVVENTPAAKKAFVESENGQLLLRYRTMLTNNPGWGTPIAVSFEMKAEYGTLILPFSVVRPADLEVFTCSGVEANGTTLTLTPIKGGLVHNTPYIIKGAVGAKYSLVGFDKGSRMTHTVDCLTGVLNEGGVDVPGGSYVLSKYQGVLAFYMVENNVSKNCPQFKCYFTAPAPANAKAFFFNPGDVTGIDAIVTDGGKVEIYNVHGQRLNGLRKGLNIVNGRKVVVK